MRGYGTITIPCERGSEGLGPVADFSGHGNDDLASTKREMFLDPPTVLNKHCLTWLHLRTSKGFLKQ